MKRLAILCAAVAAIAVAAPASSAGVRHVTVVNLTSTIVTASISQGYAKPAAEGTVQSKRDYIFDVPDLAGTLIVTAAACPGGKRLAMPLKPTDIRFVVNPGCSLSIQ